MLLIAAFAAAAATAAAEPKPSAPTLVGLTARELQARLGQPDVANGEGAGALWTFRLPGCSLLVFLQDKGRGLRVSGAEPGPLRRGAPVPALDECLASAKP